MTLALDVDETPRVPEMPSAQEIRERVAALISLAERSMRPGDFRAASLLLAAWEKKAGCPHFHFRDRLAELADLVPQDDECTP